jgi:tRNA nucleotidyltransferase (CCA-adding enzyme)
MFAGDFLIGVTKILPWMTKGVVVIAPLCHIIRVQAMPDVLNHPKIDLDQRLSAQQLKLLRVVAEAADTRHTALYLVGGFVRDLVLHIPAMDFDLVVEGDAIALAKALATQYGGRVTAHARFGTAQWFQPDSDSHALDFISTRSETYKHPGALPTVKPGRLDLFRRDFTINTLALRIDGEHWGELYDEMDGLSDLKRGLVRILNPQSFLDDPTRLFRAVRYEQRYGFQIAPETLILIPPARGLIGSLSAERIRHELDLILEEEKAVAMLNRLAELDLLQPIHPTLAWNDIKRERFINGWRLAQDHHKKTIPLSVGKSCINWHFWLMDLSLTDIESLERRLHFHGHLLGSLLAASALFTDLPSLTGMKPSQCVTRLEELPLTAVYAVFLSVPDGEARQNLYDYLETWRYIKPKTNGHDLKKRGLPPGPRYQQVLSRLRQARLDGEVKTEIEEMELLDILT